MSFKPIPQNVRRAEIKAGCEAVKKIYTNWKYDISRKRPMIGQPVSMLDVRYSLMECVILCHKDIRSAAVRLVAIRAFEEMLKRAGGPVLSPDQAFDRAMRQKDEDEKTTGPDEASIRAAIEELRKHGIAFPDGPQGAEAAAPSSRLSDPQTPPRSPLEGSGSADSPSNN